MLNDRSHRTVRLRGDEDFRVFLDIAILQMPLRNSRKTFWPTSIATSQFERTAPS
jgi:hypothetical protein